MESPSSLRLSDMATAQYICFPQGGTNATGDFCNPCVKSMECFKQTNYLYLGANYSASSCSPDYPVNEYKYLNFDQNSNFSYTAGVCGEYFITCNVNDSFYAFRGTFYTYAPSTIPTPAPTHSVFTINEIVFIPGVVVTAIFFLIALIPYVLRFLTSHGWMAMKKDARTQKLLPIYDRAYEELQSKLHYASGEKKKLDAKEYKETIRNYVDSIPFVSTHGFCFHSKKYQQLYFTESHVSVMITIGELIETCTCYKFKLLRATLKQHLSEMALCCYGIINTIVKTYQYSQSSGSWFDFPDIMLSVVIVFTQFSINLKPVIFAAKGMDSAFERHLYMKPVRVSTENFCVMVVIFFAVVLFSSVGNKCLNSPSFWSFWATICYMQIMVSKQYMQMVMHNKRIEEQINAEHQSEEIELSSKNTEVSYSFLLLTPCS